MSGYQVPYQQFEEPKPKVAVYTRCLMCRREPTEGVWRFVQVSPDRLRGLCTECAPRYLGGDLPLLDIEGVS